MKPEKKSPYGSMKDMAKKMDDAMKKRMGPQFEKMHKPKPKPKKAGK